MTTTFRKDATEGFMGGQILTIGLADEANNVFKESFALEHMHVTECRGLNEAALFFGRGNYRLIIYNASELSPDDTRETVSKIRSATYAPLIVLSTDEAVDAAEEAGADIAYRLLQICIDFSQ